MIIGTGTNAVEALSSNPRQIIHQRRANSQPAAGLSGMQGSSRFRNQGEAREPNSCCDTFYIGKTPPARRMHVAQRL
jgi:hypothetical protein